MPAIEPIRKPITVSSSVTATCIHSEPCEVPSRVHSTSWSQIIEGIE